MEFELWCLFYAVQASLFGAVSAVVANQKGRSGLAWFVLGVLLSPFGLILALVVTENGQVVEQRHIAKGRMRKCPHCAEMIRSVAIKCRYCQSDVAPARLTRDVTTGKSPTGAKETVPDRSWRRDPTRCPHCRARLKEGNTTCPSCRRRTIIEKGMTVEELRAIRGPEEAVTGCAGDRVTLEYQDGLYEFRDGMLHEVRSPE